MTAMPDVTITIPVLPPEVDAADMLRAITAKLDAGYPLDGLHAGVVRSILSQFVDHADEEPEARALIPIDLGHPSGLIWYAERRASDGRWIIIGATADDTSVVPVVIAVEDAEDDDGEDVAKEAACAIRDVLMAAVADAPPDEPPTATLPAEAFDIDHGTPQQVAADRDPNVLARKLADALDDLATERAAHEATRDALDAANDHRTVLGVVADTARELVRGAIAGAITSHDAI